MQFLGVENHILEEILRQLLLINNINSLLVKPKITTTVVLPDNPEDCGRYYGPGSPGTNATKKQRPKIGQPPSKPRKTPKPRRTVGYHV